MKAYVTTFVRRDGTAGQHLGTFPDGLAAVQHVAALHPEACSITSDGIARQDAAPRVTHDTHALPPGGYYFAPGAVEHGPSRARRVTGWRRVVLDAMALLAVAGLIGFTAGVLQAKGWPL